MPLPFHLTAQGGIIVPAIVNGIGPVSFMLDTGYDGSIPPTVSLANESVELTGLTGKRDARRVVVRAFRVGSTLLTEVPAVVVESAGDATALDGLLPLHLFARVTFNGPEHQLLIETH